LIRAAVIVLAMMLGACESDYAPAPATSVVEPHRDELHELEYDFATRSHSGGSPGVPALSSTSAGRLLLVALDEPPLFVGKLVVDHMHLRAAGEIASQLEPDEWSFLARRTGGTVDVLWVESDMPREAQSLARVLIAELATPNATPNTESENLEEQTPTGVLSTRYYSLHGGMSMLGLRARSSNPGVPERVLNAALLRADEHGAVMVGAAQVVRVALDPKDVLMSIGAVFLWRRATTALPDAEILRLRETIAALSRSSPIPLVEQPLSREEKDAMRRDAESWASVRARLLAAGADMNPTLSSRAAAYLAVDDALVTELRELALEPDTTKAATATMLLALGECGTPACQDALSTTIEQAPHVRAEALAALVRVEAPLSDTVDRLLALSQQGDPLVPATLGVLFSRFAEREPVAAADRIAQVIRGVVGCPTELEALFGLLGNAGSLASKSVLLACLHEDVNQERRAAAVGAMRRIPGADVTSILVQLVVDERNPVRLAALHALVFRELRDAELMPLAVEDVSHWETIESSELLDLVERLAEPGEAADQLLTQLTRSSHPEVAARARLLREQWDE
jgi:hypothetical protein